jgi:Protein of unknown function (DUF4058)
MPLLDHFHPPLTRRHHWESLHSAWANALVHHLNHGWLPPHYIAAPHVTVTARVEIDVSTFAEDVAGSTQPNGSVAVWAPPRPVLQTDLPFSGLEVFEVQVIHDEEGPEVVAAIEFISPANKDRASHRQQYTIKCASYLQQDISLIMVDVVTSRSGNLHRQTLEMLQVAGTTPVDSLNNLYAGAYRTFGTAEGRKLDVWTEALILGSPLPTLPLWLTADVCVPVNLELAYMAACNSLLIQ